MSRLVWVGAALAGLLFLVGSSTVFWVDETELAIVTQFGQPKQEIVNPGLQFKPPFITDVRRMEKRILTSDSPSEEFLTKDKKKLVADPITRWRIVNPLTFYEKLGNEQNGRERIDEIVSSEFRRVFANREFEEIVGEKRGPMMAEVASGVQTQTEAFGIKVLDVRIKRADLPEQVERSVFDRMTAEREKVAKGYRAEGTEQSLEIESETDRQVSVILAEAYQEAEKIRGQGDAKATKIYAQAFEKNPEFYDFVRSLEAYERSLDEGSTIVLSTGSELFEYLRGPGEAKIGGP